MGTIQWEIDSLDIDRQVVDKISNETRGHTLTLQKIENCLPLIKLYDFYSTEEEPISFNRSAPQLQNSDCHLVVHIETYMMYHSCDGAQHSAYSTEQSRLRRWMDGRCQHCNTSIYLSVLASVPLCITAMAKIRI